MMMLSTIFPIVFLVVFGLLFYVIFKVGKKYMTMKVTHWLLFIYFGILLTATIFVGLVDKENQLPNPVEQAEIDQNQDELRTKLKHGKIDEIDVTHLKNEVISEDYQGKTLTIYSYLDYGPEVFVERKANHDSQIEAFVFSSGIIINGMNFTDLLKPYSLEFADETLTIQSIYQELNLSIANNSFPVRQFTGEEMFNHSVMMNDSIVYLRVPKDLEVKTGTSGNVQLEYINQ